jgi:hypothetical protein
MLASVADPYQGVPFPPPTITTTYPKGEEDDPDGLVFTGSGMWHSKDSYGFDPVSTHPPSIVIEPLDVVVANPQELLHPGMWCAPAPPPPPSLLSSVEREIETYDKGLQESILGGKRNYELRLS